MKHGVGPVERFFDWLGFRAGCTTGQAYTAALAAIVAGALLVTATLPGVASRAAKRQADLATASGEPSPEPSAPLTGPGFPSISEATTTSLLDLLGLPSEELVPDSDLSPGDDPADPTCPAADLLLAVAGLVGTLDAIAPEVPDASLQSFLAIATGCSAEDPTLTLVALLLEAAPLIPDLGVPEIALPVLPALALPALPSELGPLQTVLRPLCATAGQAVSLVLLAAGAYPLPLSKPELVAALGTVLSACGSLTGTAL